MTPLEQHLASIAGSPLNGTILAVLLALACFGAGDIVLRRACGKGKHPGRIAAFTLGVFMCAILCFAFRMSSLASYGSIVFMVFVLCGNICALISPDIRPATFPDWRTLLLPFAAIAILSANLAVYPFINDDCVYQLTVPLRWSRTGFADVFPDLPYSGFPLLPQFIYAELITLSGVCAARAFSFILLALCTMTPFCFGGGWRASIISFALMTSPVFLFMFTGSYSEQFIALAFIAGIMCIVKTGGKRAALFAGIFAGSACAVKLTGGFVAFALFIYLAMHLRLRRKEEWRDVFKLLSVFISASALAALPFYLRPTLLTFDPFYPYFAHFFTTDPATLEMSAFHHALGYDNFGTTSISGILLAPVMLSLPYYGNVFDGDFGVQGFFILALAVCLLFHRIRKRENMSKTLPELCAVLLLYFCWFASSQQARFLLPCVLLLCGCAVRGAALFSESRKKLIFVLCSAIYGIWQSGYIKPLCMRWVHRTEKVNMLHSSARGLVPAVDKLREISDGKVLLLFEERTLYMPENCVIGTPFFQRNILTPPDGVTPESFEAVLRENNITGIWLGDASSGPDRAAKWLERSETLFKAFGILVKKGVIIPDGEHFFSVRPESSVKSADID